MIFAHFPGLKVVSPGTPEDAKGLLKSSIRSEDPVLFIENATIYQQRGEVPDGDYTIPIGKSKVQREGKDVTLVTYSKDGWLLHASRNAAWKKKALRWKLWIFVHCGLWIWVLSLNPFKKTNRAVIAEEGWKSFGIGAEVSARIYEEAFDYIDAPIIRVAQKEVPLPYNRRLEQLALPQVEDIISSVREVLK